jgi:predicted secreted Zn-dependent protease
VKPFLLLDESLRVEIAFSKEDADLEDNISVIITECCLEDEKIFKHEESHIFLTRKQARDLVAALNEAVRESEAKSLHTDLSGDIRT